MAGHGVEDWNEFGGRVRGQPMGGTASMWTGGRRGIVLATTITAVMAAAPSAGAETLADGTLTAADAVDQSCTDELLPAGPGVAHQRLTAPSLGLVHVTLDADAGDWDIAIFDAAGGQAIAGAASMGPDDVADGFVLHRTDLVVQGCRRGGDDPDAGFSVDHTLFDAAAEYATAAKAGASPGMPSGQDTYRRLFDYSDELKQLAADNPNLVRYFTLPEHTYEDRPVEGIEIAQNVKKRDGRPAFLMMGVHHAREWPSGEHTIEWAYELLNAYNDGNNRARRIVRHSRTMLVPIVNPDGFEISREAGEAEGGGGGRGGDDTQETVNIVSHPYEYRRKNCRLADDSDAGNCAQPALGLAAAGVDPNRNYGGVWGGPGASTDPTAEDYRGPGPFSEPETRNIRWLVSRNQVTTLITNHTFSGLVLRPPGIQVQGPPADERIYKKLGDSMAAENGYKSQRSYQLYDTTGTTEDWSYYATGGLGFTFEIGPTNFHPPYADVIAEYRGTTELAAGGDGNRGAYFKAERNTLRRSRHSVIEGEAPPGAKLILSKRFLTKTSPVIDGDGKAGKRIKFKDHLRTRLDVPPSGLFTWHVNPSTRPIVHKYTGPQPRPGPPSDPITFNGAAGPSAIPCGDAETNDPDCFNDHPFTVPGGSNVDNGTASVRIEWATAGSDWDMQIFRDLDGDGTSEGETEVVGASQSGPSDSEATTVVRPALKQGEDYVVRVTNFAATEPYDGTITFGKTLKGRQHSRKERWLLRCTSDEGHSHRTVLVDRGEIKHVDVTRACS